MIGVARAALLALIRSERVHAGNALARLAHGDPSRRIKGERIATYEWRQARRHLRKAESAQRVLEAIGGAW